MNSRIKLFLSYAREDVGMAKRIYESLQGYGIDIWFDIYSLEPGQDWWHEIKKAIRNRDYFLALLSSKSVDHSGYVQKELAVALDELEKYPQGKIFVLPIRLDEKCELIKVHGKLHDLQWVDLFPDNAYEEGIRRILKVIDPNKFRLRRTPCELTEEEVSAMLEKYKFFDNLKYLTGKGLPHQFKNLEIGGDKIIIDETTCLIWEQNRSILMKHKLMTYKNTQNYIEELNQRGYAGNHNWRLPTLEEAMSLMVPKNKEGFYINPLFDMTLQAIWTSDHVKDSPLVWGVNFRDVGSCYPVSPVANFMFVCAVCSSLSSDALS